MIRYVLIGILAVAILALGYAAVDHASTVNTDRQVGASVEKLEAAADSLMEQEQLPPEGHPPAQRTVTLTLPARTLTTHTVDHLEIHRIDENNSRVRYVLENGHSRQIGVGQPLVFGNPDNDEDRIEVGGGRDIDLVLSLEADEDGDRVVVVNFL